MEEPNKRKKLGWGGVGRDGGGGADTTIGEVSSDLRRKWEKIIIFQKVKKT
jgi:hypothetical protein